MLTSNTNNLTANGGEALQFTRSNGKVTVESPAAEAGTLNLTFVSERPNADPITRTKTISDSQVAGKVLKLLAQPDSRTETVDGLLSRVEQLERAEIGLRHLVPDDLVSTTSERK